MNIDAVDPEVIIDRQYATILLGYAAGMDGRILATDENADVWLSALAGGRFGAAVTVIKDYYRRYDPKAPKLDAITPGYIRYTAIERKTYQERREAALDPPPPRKGRKMPRHVLEKFQANGYLLDRDLKEY